MVRPCFLVVDREFASSLSTRKLVIETAKFNVVTAYSGQEALETLERFPALDGVVLDAGVRDVPVPDLVRKLKDLAPELPVIVVGSHGEESGGKADYHLPSFDPTQILLLLKKLQPEQAAAIEKRNDMLREED